MFICSFRESLQRRIQAQNDSGQSPLQAKKKSRDVFFINLQVKDK